MAKASDTQAQVKKAQTVAKALKKTPSTVVRKIRRNVHFFRPKTRQVEKNAKVARKSNASRNKMDEFRIVRSPLATETCMKKVEAQNTLTFLCDVKATKKQIKDAVLSIHGIKAQKINTLIRPDGVKKAFVRLVADQDALDFANRIGII